MKKNFVIFMSIAGVFGLAATSGLASQAPTTATASTAQSQSFKVCKSEYALCTIAPCDPIPGNDKQVSCHCTVMKGYSAGSKQCQGVKQMAAGEQIRSRYYPVKSYAVCSNDRSWAWCLDKPCIIDKNNPGAAACKCDVVKNLGDYVIVTDKYTPTTCTTGMISSATVQGITQITNYFNQEKIKRLTPVPMKVLNKPKQ